jgi:RNA polymerase sigma-70 factor (ECF subfamily)
MMLRMTKSPIAPVAPDEAALVVAVLQGDVECFEPLVDQHLGAVRTFLSLKAPVPQLIDELAHETFLFAFHHLSEFTPGTSFRHWLRAIAWNLLRAEILRYSRRAARNEPLEEEWLIQQAGAAPAALPADADYLEECLAALPQTSRALLDLHYNEGFDSSEIADRLTRSRAWVRTTLFRVRQQLKSCIEEKRVIAGASLHE